MRKKIAIVLLVILAGILAFSQGNAIQAVQKIAVILAAVIGGMLLLLLALAGFLIYRNLRIQTPPKKVRKWKSGPYAYWKKEGEDTSPTPVYFEVTQDNNNDYLSLFNQTKGKK